MAMTLSGSYPSKYRGLSSLNLDRPRSIVMQRKSDDSARLSACLRITLVKGKKHTTMSWEETVFGVPETLNDSCEYTIACYPPHNTRPLKDVIKNAVVRVTRLGMMQQPSTGRLKLRRDGTLVLVIASSKVSNCSFIILGPGSLKYKTASDSLLYCEIEYSQ